MKNICVAMFCAFSLAFSAGCGSDDSGGGSTGSGSSSGGGASKGPTAGLRAAICAAEKRCGATLGFPHASEAACVTGLAGAARLDAFVTAKTLTVNADAVTACTKALASKSCSVRALPAACAASKLFGGTVADGECCDADVGSVGAIRPRSSCKAGSNCNAGKCTAAADKTFGTERGGCNNDASCDVGLRCLDSKCTVGAAPGEACVKNESCAPGLKCGGACETLTAKADCEGTPACYFFDTGDAGSSCIANGKTGCAAPANQTEDACKKAGGAKNVCAWADSKCVGKTACVPNAGLHMGDHCKFDPCSAPLLCISDNATPPKKTCQVPPTKVGDACAGPCGSGLVCTAGKCATPPAVGSACTTSAECLPNVCVDKACAVRGANGAKCKAHEQCVAGLCRKDGTCGASVCDKTSGGDLCDGNSVYLCKGDCPNKEFDSDANVIDVCKAFPKPATGASTKHDFCARVLDKFSKKYVTYKYKCTRESAGASGTGNECKTCDCEKTCP